MSVSGVNSTINANSQVQQQKSKSKAKAPLYGVGAGAIAGGSIAAVSNYNADKNSMKYTLELIDNEKYLIRAKESDLLSATDADAKKHYENAIKESKQSLEKLNAKLLKYKKAIKPMGVLKSVAKAPLTYILAATGLVVGLCVNHKNKSAKQ